MARRFFLYSTLGCHLCDEAEAVLLPFLLEAQAASAEAQASGGHVIEIEIIDIAEENLIDRYGTRIPVLQCAATGAEMDWPFDLARLREWFF